MQVQTKLKNSELAEWIASIGIHLSDVQSDDEIIAGISRQYCLNLELDPDEIIEEVDGGQVTQSTRAASLEPWVKHWLAAFRAVQMVLRSGA